MSAAVATQTAGPSREGLNLNLNQSHANAVRALGICWLHQCLKVNNEGKKFQDVITTLASLRVRRKVKNQPNTEADAENEKLVNLSEEVWEAFHIGLKASYKTDETTQDKVHILKLVDKTSATVVNGAEVTVSHILGEAFELYCAISFKEKIIPIVLQERPENPPSERPPSRMRCKVERVFLSDSVYKEESKKDKKADKEAEERTRHLEWEDQEFIRGDPAKTELIKSLIDTNKIPKRSWSDVEKFVETLVNYMNDDKGFDILVQLREIDSEEKKIHFIVAQCKFRSPRDDPEDKGRSIDISSYVGKHFDIIEQARAIGVSCPFFWMATTTDFSAAEGYFSKLIEDGSLVIQGAEQLGNEAELLSMIKRGIDYLDGWKEDAEAHRKRTIAAMQPRELHPHQVDAVKKIETYFQSAEGRQAGAGVGAGGVHGEASTSHQANGSGSNFSNVVNRHASVIMATGSGKTLTAYKATTNLEAKLAKHEIQKPSLHISPMIRLVYQNAQEWFAEDIANWVTQNEGKNPADVTYDDFPIYYAVCSHQDDCNRGCTSLISIYMSELEDTLEGHTNDGSLKRCRFFTTYQGGALFWMKVRQYSLKKHKTPLHPVFGVVVRDEAHTAAGLGSKPFSAVLNVPAKYSLSFTATPKVHEIRFKERDDIQNELKGDNVTTFLHLDNKVLLPSIPYPEAASPTATNHITGPCPALDQPLYWHPFDFLSESMLFVEADESGAGSSTQLYDWAYFQKRAEELNKVVVVFFVNPLATGLTPASRRNASPRKYDVIYDHKKGRFRYFGPLLPPPSSSEADSSREGAPEDKTKHKRNEQLDEDAECFGVTEDFKTLCKPWGDKRGLVVHDMSHIGNGNYIGPIIHTLSYGECIAKRGLCPPRVIMLMPKEVTVDISQSLISKTNLETLLGLDRKAKKKYTTPEKVKWNLTINKTAVEGTALQFRAMQQLLDCFKLPVEPVRRVLVFCKDGQHAAGCMEIFRALLHKENIASQYYVNRIYSSEAHTEKEMHYREQQEILREFSGSTKAVLFNVKLIGIGVDMPGIDAVQIVQPAKSVSRIVQAYGRAMRLDSSFTEKKATFIIPAVSPYKENWSKHEPQPTKPPSPTDGNADSAAAGPSIHLGSMQPLIHTESVSPPVIAAYEAVFHLQLKLAKSMLDSSVTSIGEVFRGTQEIKDKKEENKAELDEDGDGLNIDGTTKNAEYSGATAEQLLKAITSDTNAKPLLPILGEELSALLLGAWEHVLIPDLRGDLLDNPGPPIMTEEEIAEASIILATGLARAFCVSNEIGKYWYDGYAPTNAKYKKSKKIGDLKKKLEKFGHWEKAKEKIRKHLVDELADDWGIRLSFSPKPKAPPKPKAGQPVPPSPFKTANGINILFMLFSIDELMAKLEDIPEEKDNTGGTPALTPGPTPPPGATPPPTGGTNGADASTSGGAGAKRSSGTPQDGIIKKPRNLSPALKKAQTKK